MEELTKTAEDILDNILRGMYSTRTYFKRSDTEFKISIMSGTRIATQTNLILTKPGNKEKLTIEYDHNTVEILLDHKDFNRIALKMRTCVDLLTSRVNSSLKNL